MLIKFVVSSQKFCKERVMLLSIAIMQPYFFPYIGYWQLIKSADKFVIYDDVNYIKQGWINRNRILENAEAKYYNLLLRKASSNKLINEIEIINDEKTKNKMIKRLYSCYSKAPYYSDIIELIEKCIDYRINNLALFLKHQIQLICDYLSIKTEIILSSNLKKNNDLKKEFKLFEICKLLNENVYINTIGGTTLYSKEQFEKEKINLLFLENLEISYKQFSNNFIPNLSIIDVLMFNSIEKTKTYLEEYKLI